MDRATNTNSTTKRTRFIDSTGETKTTTSSLRQSKTPRELAVASIRGHLASLPPNQSPILLKLGTENLGILINAYHKSKKIKHMESVPDYIPTSARINFRFEMTDDARRSSEFTDLEQETAPIIAEIRQ